MVRIATNLAAAPEAAGRWRAAGGVIDKMLRLRLAHASCLRDVGSAGYEGHRNYLRMLRMGVHMSSLAQSEGVISGRARAATERAKQDLFSERVVAVVDHDKRIEELDYWQQGDMSLATEEMMKRRLRLRHDRRVKGALQQFWEAALRSLQYGRDNDASHFDHLADELDRESYEAVFKRLYR